MTLSRDLLLHPLPGVLRQAALARVQPGMRIVVPNVQAGIDLKRQLQGEVSCITLTQLARETLRQAGWSALKPQEAHRFFEQAVADVEFEYLAPVRDRRSTTSVLFALVTELERDNILPADLLKVAAVGRERDVARAYEAYHTSCAQKRRYDVAGAEHFAALLQEIAQVRGMVFGFAYFDPAQRHFLHRVLAHGSAITLPGSQEGSSAQRTGESLVWLQAAGFSRHELTGSPVSLGDQMTLAYWHGHEISVAKAEFPDIDAEVRACLREVRTWLAGGTPPERIAIVVRREETYLETLADVAAEYRIPLVSGAQRSLLQTPLGGLIQCWIDAQRAAWRFNFTQALLTHPLLNLPFDASEQARLLRPESPRGLYSWSPELTWLILPEETTWREALVGVVQRLLTEFGVLERCRHEPTLNTALTLFMDRLRLQARRDTPCTAEQILSTLSFTLRDVRLPALTGKVAVRVVNPLAALGREFDRVWLLGLSDTIFPAGRKDHPLIDAMTRQAWQRAGVDVPDLSRLASVEEALFLGSVATARETLILSRPVRQLSGRELAPSPFWSRIAAIGQLEKRSPASALEQHLDQALSGHPSRRWERGMAAERSRTTGLLTSHTGQLQLPIDVSTRQWTLDELQTALTCRYRWWTEYVVGARPALPAPWDDLRREALHAVMAHRPVSGALAADLADLGLEDAAQRLFYLAQWRYTSLWPAQQIELLKQLRHVLSHPDFLPQGWTPLQINMERTTTVGAHGHSFTIQVPLDRLDHTPRGLVLTSYHGRAAPSGPLTLDHRLALQLQASGAAAGRHLCPRTGEAHSTLRHVSRSSQNSPITHLRALLAELGDHLASGNIAPPAHPARQTCQRCPLTHTCRVRPQEAA